MKFCAAIKDIQGYLISHLKILFLALILKLSSIKRNVYNTFEFKAQVAYEKVLSTNSLATIYKAEILIASKRKDN